MGAVSYMGVPLTDLDGTVLGHLAVMDRKPMPAMPESITLFEIFAGRAAAELRRLRAEQQVREREAQLAGWSTAPWTPSSSWMATCAWPA